MRVNHFPAFPGTLRAYYGPYESLITFQCQVVENEASAQTDRSLKLPPVQLFSDLSISDLRVVMLEVDEHLQ